MANGSTADKARKARNKADDAVYGYGTAERIANKVAKTATGKDLTMAEEERAAKIIYGRRVRDTARTATRANFIERRTEKKASSDRLKAAVGGGSPKKQAPKPTTKATTKKVAPAKPKAGIPKTGRQNVKKAGKK
jgi:hypothetical protein